MKFFLCAIVLLLLATDAHASCSSYYSCTSCTQTHSNFDNCAWCTGTASCQDYSSYCASEKDSFTSECNNSVAAAASLAVGIIVAIVVGVVVCICACVAFCVCLGRQNQTTTAVIYQNQPQGFVYQQPLMVPGGQQQPYAQQPGYGQQPAYGVPVQ